MPMCVELCAGCGCMSLALKEAGFDHLLMIEHDSRCVDTLKTNGFKNIHFGSVENVDFTQYKGVELVCGGVPCVAFSIAGKNRGEADERNLWPHAIRAVQQSECKAFLFENSAHMNSKRHRPYLDKIIIEFESLGFTVYKFIIDCADYGVPMHRKRVLLIGLLHPSCPYIPPDTSPHITVHQALCSLGPPNGLNSHTLRCATPRTYPGHSGSTLDAPSKSLVAGSGHGVGGGNNCLQQDDGSLRYYSPREAATLQTLPTTFNLHPTFSVAMRQLGNAFPKEAAKRFALQLLPHLH